jgi:glycosyltransferase involved in cell wall biosynthesis
MRIVAVLSVKDEIELIVPAIAHLRAIGVDRIIACDMGSTDGTWEVLERHRSDADFWVTRLSDQTPDHFETWSRVNTALVRSARADWAIFLDADEFWLPASGNLKDCAALVEADFLHVKRFNVPAGAQGAMFPAPAVPAQYEKALLLQQPADGGAPTGPQMPWIMARPEDKLMVRPELLAAIGLGAHDVIPRAGVALRRAVPKDLLVAHLPFTTKARFSRKIDNIRKVFATHDKAFGEAVAFHWRRWLALQEVGKLDAELDASLFNAASLKRLRAEGRLTDAAAWFALGRGDDAA